MSTLSLVFDRDALPETCREPGHVWGCAGRAGGDHEIDPATDHAPSMRFVETWEVNDDGTVSTPLDYMREPDCG